jgi:hypothetical protein
MDILKVAGLAILGVVTAMFLKQGKGEYSTIIGLAMALLVCGLCARYASFVLLAIQ